MPARLARQAFIRPWSPPEHWSVGIIWLVIDPGAHAKGSLAAWDVGAASVRPVRLKNNQVFVVESIRGRFVLRLHRPGYRTVEHTRSELVFLDGLGRAAGLRVPRPVPTRTGEFVALVPDDQQARHCDLLTWIDGQPRRPGTRPGLGPRGCTQLGELIGRVHAFSAHFEPPAGFDLPRWDADGLVTERSPYRPGPVDAVLRDDAERALFREVERRTRVALAGLAGMSGAGAAGGVGVIHADFILGNVVWRGHEPGLLDFDDCGWGHFVYDLAPLVGNLMDYADHQRLRTAFLEGYRRVRSLAPEHEALLETLVAARHAASCLWAVGNVRSGGGLTVEEAERHLSYRLDEVRRCLGEAG